MKNILLISILMIVNTFCSQTEKLLESSSVSSSTRKVSIPSPIEDSKINIINTKDYVNTYSITVKQLGDSIPDYPFLISKNVKESEYQIIALASEYNYVFLVYSTLTLQLLGFITEIEDVNRFYFFSDTPDSIIGIIPNIQQYISLRYQGTYESLGEPNRFTRNRIIEHIEVLSTYEPGPIGPIHLKPVLADIQYLTTDSWRFKSIAKDIEHSLFKTSGIVDPSLYQKDYLNWSEWSKLAFDWDSEAIKKIGIADINYK